MSSYLLDTTLVAKGPQTYRGNFRESDSASRTARDKALMIRILLGLDQV